MDNILFKIVKPLNMLYVGVLYMILGGIIAIIVNFILPKRDEETCKKMNIVYLGIETVFLSSTLYLMVYYVRGIVKKIGSPLDGIAGFDFYKLREINGGIVLSFAIILFSKKIITMGRIFSERVTDGLSNKHLYF